MNTQTQTLHVESWPLDRLIITAHHVRAHLEARVPQIAANIAEFGFNHPVLAIVVSHLSQNQKQAFRIAYDSMAPNAGWDPNMLTSEMDSSRLRLESTCDGVTFL